MSCDAPPIPAFVPAVLSTGDVCAILGMSRDEVRHHTRQGRFGKSQPWGYYTRREYDPEAVARFAELKRITPDWDAVR